MEYAHNKGYCDPACTDVPSQGNTESKREIDPQRIRNLIVRKKSRTHIEQKGESNPEETRMKDISNFDPRIVSHRGINDDDTSKLHKKIKETLNDAVILKCLDSIYLRWK